MRRLCPPTGGDPRPPLPWPPFPDPFPPPPHPPSCPSPDHLLPEHHGPAHCRSRPRPLVGTAPPTAGFRVCRAGHTAFPAGSPGPKVAVLLQRFELSMRESLEDGPLSRVLSPPS